MPKVVLITGASSGIGKACAEHLADNGFIVYGTSRKPLFSEKENLFTLQMDVTDRESVDRGVSKIIEEQGKIDVIMNNAGIGIAGALELATEEEIRLQMETNFMGMVNVCTSVIPYFKEEKKGKIINVSSIGGVMGLPFQGFYSASKFAVEGYSESLSLELHKFNIKVVLIEPGDFSTGFTGSRLISEATKKHPHYQDIFNRAFEVIEKEELGGSHPQEIASLVEKIIRKRNPKFRYPIGKFEQVLSIYAKRLLPNRWYQGILRNYYKMG